MSASGAKKQIGLGVLVVLSVSLLTLLFSFLGTIACGALLGMMTGANRARHFQWQLPLLSLVFPVVMLSYLNVWKSDFTPGETTVLCMICFACFWVMWLLTRLMIHFEDHGSVSPSPAGIIGASLPVRPSLPERSPGAGNRPPGLDSAGKVGLAELQGCWQRQVTGGDGRCCTKILEITTERSVLRLVSADGEGKCLCQGDLKISECGPYHVLAIVDVNSIPSSVQRSDSPTAVWSGLYRVLGQTLMVAAHFEACPPSDKAPEVECFTKAA
jgi:hypothetical protein